MINVVSVRVGSKYDSDYVWKLHDQIARNLSNAEDVRHWCLTDDPHALPDGVTPITPMDGYPGWWTKIQLFSDQMPWERGERVLYMDLDVVITGSLEDLAETKGIIRDWHWPCFNSSVMVWDHGDYPEIAQRFRREWMDMRGRIVPSGLLPQGQINGGDQEWITEAAPDWPTFPPDWCVSYTAATVWPPANAKVVVFHGEAHKPHLCPKGSWVHNVWKVGGFTSLPEMQGMNVSHDHALANVAQNIKLDVDWFTGRPPHNKTAVLVCGGPSMKDHIRQIREHKQRGARIITVNNALKYLMGVGIKPDHHVILDARPENVSFLEDAPEGVRYFLASQVDPSLFAALRGSLGRYDVICWHNAMDANSAAMRAMLEPVGKPVVMVPGGCTVGLRTLWLLWGSGYRKVHVYGMDSSYSAGEHHAYAQSLNDTESTLEVVMAGQRYICAPWMARQANDFGKQYPELLRAGVRIWVHGTGLIPDMYGALRAQEVEAA